MHIGVHVGVQNTTLDAAVKRLRAQGVPYHMHPGGYGHQLGSVWTAGPGALGFELQGKFDLDGVMTNQSLMDYCSPSSNGDIFRDVIDDETTMLDAIAWDDDEGGNVTTAR